MKEMRIPHVEIRRTNEITCCEIDITANGHASVVPLLRQILAGREQENFVMLIIGAGGRVEGYQEVARGLADQVQIPIRELFRTAITCGARALYVAHNHPSGNPSPSKADDRLTERLRLAGAIIELPILDHIIIGGGESYFSYAGGGWQSSATLPQGERQGPELD